MRVGVDFRAVRAEVERAVGSGPSEKVSANLPYAPQTKRALSHAVKEVESRPYRRFHGKPGLTEDDIFLGLLRVGDEVGVRVLSKLGVDLQRLLQAALDKCDLQPGKLTDDSLEVQIRPIGGLLSWLRWRLCFSAQRQECQDDLAPRSDFPSIARNQPISTSAFKSRCAVFAVFPA
jgi:hypothetical protein